ARVVRFRPEHADAPALVMLDGEGLAVDQELLVRRDGSEVVRVLVLRVEGAMAMAMPLAGTWAEGQDELRAGDGAHLVQ
ncbi:MAG: hypothetical protein ACYTF0_02755, partial [Planctomycetota bacterium]